MAPGWSACSGTPPPPAFSSRPRCRNSSVTVTRSTGSPFSNSSSMALYTTRWPERYRSSRSRTSATLESTSLLRRIAPSTEVSASRLWGGTRLTWLVASTGGIPTSAGGIPTAGRAQLRRSAVGAGNGVRREIRRGVAPQAGQMLSGEGGSGFAAALHHHLDGGAHPAAQLDGDLELAQGLDGLIQHELFAGKLISLVPQAGLDVGVGYRAE